MHISNGKLWDAKLSSQLQKENLISDRGNKSFMESLMEVVEKEFWLKSLANNVELRLIIPGILQFGKSLIFRTSCCIHERTPFDFYALFSFFTN